MLKFGKEWDLDAHLTPQAKTKLQQTTEIHVNCETIKHLEETWKKVLQMVQAKTPLTNHKRKNCDDLKTSALWKKSLGK